jgi:hypothetical protein
MMKADLLCSSAKSVLKNDIPSFCEAEETIYVDMKYMMGIQLNVFSNKTGKRHV